MKSLYVTVELLLPRLFFLSSKSRIESQRDIYTEMTKRWPEIPFRIFQGHKKEINAGLFAHLRIIFKEICPNKKQDIFVKYVCHPSHTYLAWPLTLTYGLLTRLSIDTIYSFKDLYNTDLGKKLSFKFSETWPVYSTRCILWFLLIKSIPPESIFEYCTSKEEQPSDILK